MAFEFAEDTFDGIPIPIGLMLESEPLTAECFLEPRPGIDKKLGISDKMIITQLREENLGDCGGSRRIKSEKQQAVRCGIDGCVKSVLLVVAQNHRLVERDLIGFCTTPDL